MPAWRNSTHPVSLSRRRQFGYRGEARSAGTIRISSVADSVATGVKSVSGSNASLPSSGFKHHVLDRRVEQRVAIGTRFGDDGGADHRVRAGSILDDHGLVQSRREFWPRWRANRSGDVPAGSGTTMRIGRSGHAACALRIASGSAEQPAMRGNPFRCDHESCD